MLCDKQCVGSSVSKGFYLGKPNPFSFPQFHVFSSLKQMSQLGPGPKVCVRVVCHGGGLGVLEYIYDMCIYMS